MPCLNLGGLDGLAAGREKQKRLRQPGASPPDPIYNSVTRNAKRCDTS